MFGQTLCSVRNRPRFEGGVEIHGIPCMFSVLSPPISLHACLALALTFIFCGLCILKTIALDHIGTPATLRETGG